VRTLEAVDTSRSRTFPCEVWYPAASGTYPLVAYSHHSGGNRRVATFLCTHLASHGYVVAALDHSEVVAPELGPHPGESAEQRSARTEAWIESRVPDVRFLLDHVLESARLLGATPDPDRIGLVGHSFGGWTVLAVPEVDDRIRSVVGLAPAGSSIRRPGIIPATLTFEWARDIPTLYLVGDHDTSLPLAGMVELFERTPGAKQMVILHRADHMHFVDEIESSHEAARALPAVGDLAWLSEMRPIAELCPPDDAHLFVRGLTVAHLDATLRGNDDAQRFLRRDVQAELAARGVDATVYEPEPPTLYG
jgi:dienelactone hydrolase